MPELITEGGVASFKGFAGADPVFFVPPFVRWHLPLELCEVIAFDVTRCPLAEYLEDQGWPELAPYAACRLYFAAACAYDVRTVRT